MLKLNTVESYIIETPDGTLGECSKLVIDDIATPLTMKNIMAVEKEYALSLWVSSEAAGYVKICGKEIETTSAWTRFERVFTANGKDLLWNFLKAGTYYIYHPQLEQGNKVTDWSPSPFDMESWVKAELKVLSDQITLKVSEADVDGNYLIGKINLTSTTALISAKHINLKGSVTISSLDDNLAANFTTDEDGVTEIDGARIKTGTITALGEVTAGSFNLGNGKFVVDNDGVLTATGATIKGDIEASTGSIGPFNIESYDGINASYFHDSDAVQMEVHLYGKLLHYATEEYDVASTYRGLYYTFKSGDPDEGWRIETDMMIGAINNFGDGFSTLIYNSRGGHILLNEGVELCGTYARFPSEVIFRSPENARQAIGIEVGYVEASDVNGVPAGGYKDVTVTFSKAFSEVPYVYLTLISTSELAGVGAMEAVPKARTTTGATIRIYNNSDKEKRPGVQWVAIGN